MSIRSVFLSQYSGSSPLLSHTSSRQEQLKSLALYAQRQLERAFHDGRQLTIRACARFLLDCYTLIDRIEARPVPNAAQSELERACELERQSVLAMLQARPDIFEVFCTFHEQVKQSQNPS
jgi:hypothetical protein